MNLSPTAFQEIRKVVHDLCGIVITADKEYLIKSRFEPILIANGLPSYELFLQRLKQPGSLILQEQAVEAITTKETSFNRDGHPFDELRRTIFPALAQRHVERRSRDRPSPSKLRLWCSAAATGQEVYSVAMALTDVVNSRRIPGLSLDDVSILATDISSNALAVARAGRYSTTELGRGLTREQRDRFFHQEDETWVAGASLRHLVDFRRLNLVRPLPELGTFDLILCRNLLIYFDETTRRRLCNALYSALNPQGLLIVGAAESLYGVSDAFVLERSGNTVYYRKP
ncbi:CheR family methyltransferase [Singulisphaera rosea]